MMQFLWEIIVCVDLSVLWKEHRKRLIFPDLNRSNDNKIHFSELNGVKTFNPDVPDFALQEIKLKPGSISLAPVESAAITIVISGVGKIGDIKERNK